MDQQRRQTVAKMWALGDYQQLAQRLQPAAVELASIVGAGNGQSALDLAAGTGTLAAALANQGWRVTATDISPPLIEQGKQATAAWGVDWHEASMDELPFADHSFDLVASSFGLIFAPDAQLALAEAARCLQPSGRLAFTAWTPEGYMGQQTALMAQYLPPRPSPMEWGRPDIVAQQLNDAGFAVEYSQRHMLPLRFTTAAAGAQFFFEHSPGHVASASLAADRSVDMIAAVERHLAEAAEEGTEAIEVAVEYTITVAVKQSG